MAYRLILASASPQRKSLLGGLGVSFETLPSGVDEDGHDERDPGKRAQVLASLKAKDVAVRNPGAWVIGCDTLVVSPEGELLEKARNPDEARAMVAAQSGGTSVVHSGLSLIDPSGKEFSGLSSSSVTFRRLSDTEIDAWIASGIWRDRSGSFQIDGPGQLLIEKLEGDWTSVVGLPVYLLGELCRTAQAPFLNPFSLS